MKETHSPSQAPLPIHRQNFEENRLIRYLIPPFLFLLSLLLAMFDPHFRNLLDPVVQWMRSAEGTTTGVTALIQFLAAGAFAVVAFGFLISSVSMYFLRWWNPNYEEEVSSSALGSIRTSVGGTLGFDHKSVERPADQPEPPDEPSLRSTRSRWDCAGPDPTGSPR